MGNAAERCESAPVKDARPDQPVPHQFHLRHLDGIRALAALYVVLYHAWTGVYKNYRPKGALFLLTGWLHYGRFPVDVFIVLSGFCLMLPVVRGDGTLRGGVTNFFRRRARRILPPYYCALILSLVLTNSVISWRTEANLDYSVPYGSFSVVTHFLLIHNLFRETIFQINAPMWSVAVECQIYVLFPCLLLLWTRYGGRLVTGIAAAVSCAAYALLQHSALSGLTPQFAGLFTMGMFAASVCFSNAKGWEDLRNHSCWPGITAVLGLIIGVFCYTAGWNHAGGYIDFLVGGFAVSLLILTAVPKQTRLRRFLGCSVLTRLGMFSYSIYLLHMPLLELVWQYVVNPLWQYVVNPLPVGAGAKFLLLVSAGMPLILGLSYLFFHLCERPFMTGRFNAFYKNKPVVHAEHCAKPDIRRA